MAVRVSCRYWRTAESAGGWATLIIAVGGIAGLRAQSPLQVSMA